LNPNGFKPQQGLHRLRYEPVWARSAGFNFRVFPVFMKNIERPEKAVSRRMDTAKIRDEDAKLKTVPKS
jgi:hypothetical protein